MFIEIELAALLALQAVTLLRKRSTPQTTQPEEQPLKQEPTAAAAAAALPSHGGTYEIVKRVGDTWAHVGHRHTGHPDLREARLTSGLAIRHRDGSLEEGIQ